MALKTLRIATRKSPLALWQAEFVGKKLQQYFPELQVELVKMTTRGDRILDAPLAKVGGKGLFVKELEIGMLEGRADIAVHSMKDVPVEFPEGLHLACILKREDPCDAMVAKQFSSIRDLPVDAKIGTSSLRRQCQIKASLPDAQIFPLRGNVNTRLAKLDAGEFDAIMLASAGLKRLGYEARITEKLSDTISLPAIGQGAIGIECCAEDAEINRLLAPLNHTETSVCVAAERAMNQHLQGGCQVPIAGYATLTDDRLFLRGLVGKPDGSMLLRAEKSGPLEHAAALGVDVAEQLLAQGADEILASLSD